MPRPEDLAVDVVVYSTTWCGYGRMAEGLLALTGTPYERVDVTRNPRARTWLRETTGHRTVPQVFVRGRSIGGFQELFGLVRRGELRGLIR